MGKKGRFFLNLFEERMAYRLVLSFALMGIIPMLLTIYLIVVIWLPNLALWSRISVILLLGLSASILGFLLSRSVVYTILKTSKAAKAIADGDLSKRIEVSNEHSEMSTLVSSFNEITSRLEHKIAELTESEEKYRHLVDNVPDLLYYLDTNGIITSMNDEVTELLGFDKEELQNQPFSLIVHEEDYEKYERVLRERRQNESRLAKGLRIRLKANNDEYHIFEINSRGIYDADGAFVGTEGLARDISVQLALEAEREEFIYMLSHDIKNPISAILFIIYMLRDGTITADKYPDYYDKIEVACNGVIGLVEDFLEYKKFELGTVNLDKNKVDLCRMLSDIGRTYASEAEANGKTITVNGKACENIRTENRIIANVDERYFLRVVENILTNAIKFTNSQIDIALTQNDDDIILSITDDGPGVSEEEKGDIFRLFHTSGGKRITKGIGVGLASARKIVTAHGGRLWVESAPNTGCSFKISIPGSTVPQKINAEDIPYPNAVPSDPARSAVS